MDDYIFGYGSLTNEGSVDQTGRVNVCKHNVTLKGFQRVFCAPVNGYLYLSLIKNKNTSVSGVIVRVPSATNDDLKQRELNYRRIDVSNKVTPRNNRKIYTFVVRCKKFLDIKIPLSYIATCLDALPQDLWGKWIDETIIENDIIDDLDNPIYETPSFDIFSKSIVRSVVRKCLAGRIAIRKP